MNSLIALASSVAVRTPAPAPGGPRTCSPCRARGPGQSRDGLVVGAGLGVQQAGVQQVGGVLGVQVGGLLEGIGGVGVLPAFCRTTPRFCRRRRIGLAATTLRKAAAAASFCRRSGPGDRQTELRRRRRGRAASTALNCVGGLVVVARLQVGAAQIFARAGVARRELDDGLHFARRPRRPCSASGRCSRGCCGTVALFGVFRSTIPAVSAAASQAPGLEVGDGPACRRRRVGAVCRRQRRWRRSRCGRRCPAAVAGRRGCAGGADLGLRAQAVTASRTPQRGDSSPSRFVFKSGYPPVVITDSSIIAHRAPLTSRRLFLYTHSRCGQALGEH